MNSRSRNGSWSSSGAWGSSFKVNGRATVDGLTHSVSDVRLNSAEGDGWQLNENKSRNKGGNRFAKQSGPPQLGANAWSQPDTVNRLGMRSYGGPGRVSGQTWPTQPSDSRKPAETDEDDDDTDVNDDSDEDLASDGFDSDESQKSHETRKQNKWFKAFFDSLEKLTVSQINEPERQWHCPACKGGPGAIDWYRGLQPLILHARTKRSKRVKLHRELADLLDEELFRKGATSEPAGETFGKWKGLEEMYDKEIVWPPMVMIMNTQLEKDQYDKWIGMGNQDLLDEFSKNSYNAQKARHSYGPQGHRGMSVLIFESSAVGYTEAERLSKHFEDKGRDRNAWGRNRELFYPGGKRQLYGFMALKQDLDSFNLHSQGKSKLKYEMKSYHEMVVNPLKQMREDNQKMLLYKQTAEKALRNNKALEESQDLIAEKLRRTAEANKIMKLRIKEKHDENKELMDTHDEYFNDKLQQLYEERDAKGENFERIQRYEREKMMTLSEANMSSWEENRVRREEVTKRLQLQEKEMDEFLKVRDVLFKAHQHKMMELKRMHFEQMEELKRKQFEEEMVAEKEFDAEFDQLLDKYTPKGTN